MQKSSNRIRAHLSGWFTLIFALLLLSFSVALQPVHAAGGESYDYDGLGRLVRAISSSGVVTEYVYDAAGNITAVIRGGAASPPTLSNVAPASMRRGSQVRVTLTGTALQNVALQALDRELTISNIARTPTSLVFDLAASLQATLGASTLRVSSASGTSSVTINVRPVLPSIQLSPLPIAVPPDGRSAAIDVVLSGADDQAHTIALSTANPNIATVSPSTLTIPSGSLQATVLVTGRLAGNTELRLESATLGNSAFPIFVLAAFEGINTARANLVGVQLAGGQAPATTNGLFAGLPVGIVRADTAWLDTSPRFVSEGGTQTLQITGKGLPPTLAAAVVPSAGLTVAAPTVAGDGRSATVSISASAGTLLGARRLVLTTTSGSLTPVTVGADLLDVVAPLPEVVSVQPIVVAAGNTVPVFEIRGRNLQDATGVQVLGGGVAVGSALTSNADGTALQVALQVSPAAQPGPRTVVVFAPGGNSSTVATLANTLTVAPDGAELQPFADLTAPLVGITKGSGPTPAPTASSVDAAIVGVATGPMVVSSTPATIARTETVNLVIQGQFLAAANAVSVTPNAGLTLGPPTVSGDGRQVTMQITAAPDAPLGARRIDLLAGGQPLRIAGSGALALQVTLLTPVIESITPNSAIPSGVPFDFTVRGRNLLGATAVRFSPAGGVTVGALSVNPAGNEIRLPLTIAANAVRGVRTVTVLTPAGESSTTPGPNNQFTLSDGPALTDLSAAPVGVVLGTAVPFNPPEVSALIGAPIVGVAVGSLVPSTNNNVIAPNVGVVLGSVGAPQQTYDALAPMVGVVRGSLPDPGARAIDLLALPTGVARGPIALLVEPGAWVPGQTGLLVVNGFALPPGTTVQILPAGAATLNGTPAVDVGGGAVRQGLTVNASTTLPAVEVALVKPDGTFVPAVGAAARNLVLLPGTPEIVSLDPILARQGDTGTLIIRGTRLKGASRVAAEPGTGIEFASDFTVNGAGTELQIRYQVRPDASLGPQVIRVFNLLGGSAATASPANTFTVFP